MPSVTAVISPVGPATVVAETTLVQFAVQFSAEVDSFNTATVVTLGGTIAGTPTVSVSGAGSYYLVTVGGFFGNGTVTLQIPSGSTVDSVQTFPTASNTATITVNCPIRCIISPVGPSALYVATSSVQFTVKFSESVDSFGATDLTAGGTAPGARTIAVTGSGSTYTVTVSGITGNGTVTLQVPLSATVDSVYVLRAASNVSVIEILVVGSLVFSCSGITQVASVSYTVSHGISPQPIEIVCDPSSTPARSTGITFGVSTQKQITLTDCALDLKVERFNSSERQLLVTYLDRRWRWALGPQVEGYYNQLDRHKKLIPRTVRSPYQMAVILLTAMGESGYTIDLPGGLAVSAGSVPTPGPQDTVVDASAEYLKLGQNVPATGTNPTTTWVGIPAAKALQALCDTFGRRIVFNPITNTVQIVVQGKGVPFPSGARLSYSPTYDPDIMPANVQVALAPTRFQVRLACRAVAKEWDGSYVPLYLASYAPPRSPQAMVADISSIGADGIFLNGVGFVQASLANYATAINASADTRINGVVTAAIVSGKLRITAVTAGVEFEVYPQGGGAVAGECLKGPVAANISGRESFAVSLTAGTVFAPGTTYTVTVNGVAFAGVTGLLSFEQVAALLQLAINTSTDTAIVGKCLATFGNGTLYVASLIDGVGTLTVTGSSGLSVVATSGTNRGFEYTIPPAFYNVRATPRLRRNISEQLAQESVYRAYQVVCIDPGDKLPGIRVPEIGTRIANRYQLILQGTMPEQIEPRAGDVNRTDPQTGQPYAAEYYDGYAHDRRPRAFGSVFRGVQAGGIYTAADYFGNTLPRQEFFIPFSVIDPEWQVIQFDRPAFRYLGKTSDTTPFGCTTQPVDLVIETGVTIIDPVTNAPYRYTATAAVQGGTGPTITYLYEGAQQEIIGVYDQFHNLIDKRLVDTYASSFAAYYAAQIAAKYQIAGAVSADFGGFLDIAPDGFIQQITWSYDRSGPSTTVSGNYEHSRTVLPYAARRRKENLPPDPAQARQNLMSDWAIIGANSVQNFMNNTMLGRMMRGAQ